jgi:nucleotide-binding universal stress UspA family protein
MRGRRRDPSARGKTGSKAVKKGHGRLGHKRSPSKGRCRDTERGERLLFERILLPVDGSATAEAALRSAVDLVHRSHASLHLVMVRETAAPADPESRTGAPIDGDDDERAGDYLAGIAAKLISSDGIRARIAVLHGDAADSLLQYVRVHAIDLVIISTRGAGWSGPVAGVPRGLGRCADRLARSLEVPLLLFPPAAPHRAFDHIHIAVDGSANAAAALAATGVLLFQTSHATLVHVIAPASPQSGGAALLSPEAAPPGQTASPTEAIAATANLAGGVRGAWRSVSTQVVTGAHPDQDILRIASDAESALVVMSRLGQRTNAPRATLGPVVEAVLGQTDIPILLFPAETGAAARSIPPDHPVDRPPPHSA